MLDLITNINDPNFIDLDALPASIYWKNKDGVYLGRNLFAAKKMQEVNLEQELDINFILGKTDFDLFTDQAAQIYQKNDFDVINNNCTIVREEKIHLENGKILTQISTKKPLININNEIIGIIGITFDLTSNTHEKKSQPMLINKVKLNPRMVEMLRLIIRGKTAKQIAITFNLSHRTVEHYISNIKQKFKVRSKAELIEKVIEELRS